MGESDAFVERWKLILKDFIVDAHIEGIIKLLASSQDLEEFTECWIGDCPMLTPIDEDFDDDRISN